MARNQFGLGAFMCGRGKAIYEIEPSCPLHGDRGVRQQEGERLVGEPEPGLFS